ncbi:hypothetical protein B566_EDAN006548 [Ephemera danica]|nr:hypothetical protein B566_EDAN006548 [Ephemera danica]
MHITQVKIIMMPVALLLMISILSPAYGFPQADSKEDASEDKKKEDDSKFKGILAKPVAPKQLIEEVFNFALNPIFRFGGKSNETDTDRIEKGISDIARKLKPWETILSILSLLVVPAFRADDDTFQTNIGRPASYKDGNPLEIIAEVAKVVDTVGSVVGSMIANLDPMKNKGNNEKSDKDFEFFNPRGISRVFKKIFNLDKHCGKDKKIPTKSTKSDTDNGAARDVIAEQTHGHTDTTESVTPATEAESSPAVEDQ